ncbi:MAG: hypothetical protein M3Z03_00520 [Actinomycetota bacterium]|nr:hypothetical protein [Actinomycetota bacterium]
MGAAPIGLLDYLVGLALAFVVIVATIRRPATALIVLTVYLPVQTYFVAFLHRLGFPLAAVRGAGWLKEGILVGIAVAAIHHFRQSNRKFDGLDRLALVWLAGVTIYLFIPSIVSAPDAPLGLNPRIQGFRTNAFYVILFLAARHAPLPADMRRRFAKAFGGVMAFVAALGVYQFIDPQGWIRFTTQIVQVPRYKAEVQFLTPAQLVQDFGWLSLQPVRVGSVLISPTEFVDLLLIALAIAVERLTRGANRLVLVVGTATIAFAMVASRTRINLVAAVLVLVLLLRPSPGRVAAARVRLALLFFLGILLVAPFQIGTRITGGEGGAESSTAHVGEFTTGLRHLLEEPRGFGLGTAPSVGARFGFEQTFISDNVYLQVGNELGIVMMGLWIALMFTVLRYLHAAHRAPPFDPLAAALWAAGLGLAVVGMLHQVWLSIPVAWLFFLGCGIALHAGDHEHDPAEPHARAVLR